MAASSAPRPLPMSTSRLAAPGRYAAGAAIVAACFAAAATTAQASYIASPHSGSFPHARHASGGTGGVITKHAAVAAFAGVTGVDLVAGTVTKRPDPVLVQDKPWEPRLDNGYPNIVYNASDPSGMGTWRLWYGDCANTCSAQVLLHATSTDGLTWDKPDLGLFNLTSYPHAGSDLAKYGTHNNIIMAGGGLGVYEDPLEPDGSPSKYKAFGQGSFGPGGQVDYVSGTGVSADGLTWTDAQAVTWPKPQRYDCHNNPVRDLASPHGQFVLTTRDYTSTDGRCIAVAKGDTSGDFAGWDATTTLVEQGSEDHQLYSQITIPFYDAWLGIVMVYDANTPAQKVHCRLSWAPSAGGPWAWVPQPAGSGQDFIPLGSNGAASCNPDGWEPVEVDGRKLSDCDAYRAGKKPEHYICDSAGSGRVSVGEMPLEACHDACSASTSCTVVQWQGEQQHNYSATQPGQCFLLDKCDKADPYNTKLAPTFCMDIAACDRPAPGPNAFDSYICFAAAHPVQVPGEPTARVYYMGGNGPHFGQRNSSLGLAHIRPDGFAGAHVAPSSSGSGDVGAGVTARPVTCTGATPIVTADVGPGCSLAVGFAGLDGLEPADMVTPFSSNVTDAAVTFAGGADLSAYVGKQVALQVVVASAPGDGNGRDASDCAGASVYSFGFSS